MLEKLTCPRCGRPEVNEAGDALYIRGYKVDMGRGWESECLVCNIWFLDDGTITEEPARPNWKRSYDKDGNKYELRYCEEHGWYREDVGCRECAHEPD